MAICGAVTPRSAIAIAFAARPGGNGVTPPLLESAAGGLSVSCTALRSSESSAAIWWASCPPRSAIVRT
eukprot:1634082-Prymnesium_polylepis.1